MMATSGALTVNDNGAAIYAVSIDTPPGTAGVSPDLSLVYTSQSGNGLLGMGWQLSGLSAIERCAQTPERDGRLEGVTYTATDRFCLDGKQLVALNQPYFEDGSEYRTLIDGFSRIIASGTAGSGPASFTVYTKAGLTLEYGTTADSRIEAAFKSEVRVWALSKVRDTAGNYFTVSYDVIDVLSDYKPVRIDYTGNASTGLVPYASVRFTYENRPDAVGPYVAGSQSTVLQRMKTLATYVGETKVMEYQLDYESSPATLRSRMTSIAKCDGTGLCLPPIQFAWSGHPRDLPRFQNVAVSDAGTCGGPTYQCWFSVADVNGDGIGDAVRHQSNDGVTASWLGLGNGGFGDNRNTATLKSSCDDVSVCWFGLADVDGDGLADAVRHQPVDGATITWLSLGNGYFDGNRTTPTGSCGNPADCFFRLADIDGDGRADAVRHNPADGSTSVWLSQGDGYFGGNITTNTGSCGLPGDCWFLLGDMNADGRADIVMHYPQGNGGLQVFSALPDGHFTGTSFTSIGWCGDPSTCFFTLADVDGDGLTDAVRHDPASGNTTVWRNHGGGSFSGNLTQPTGQCTGGPESCWFTLADVDGDGAADAVMHLPNQNGVIGVWPSNKNGHFAPNYSVVLGSCGTPSDCWFTMADVTGDGSSDVVRFQPADEAYAAWPSKSTNSDRIVSITSGLGVVTEIDHVALSDPGAPYTADSTSAYPTIDLETALFVVAEVRSDDGLGGQRTSRYRYGGLKYSHSSRNLLGFRWIERENVEAGTVARTEFRQDFPYTGSTELEQILRASGGNGGLLQEVETQYGCEDFAAPAGCVVDGARRYFVFPAQSVERAWDLTGTVLPTVTTETTYDDWGNALTVEVATSDGFSKVTSNTYSNPGYNAAIDAWILGRLLRAEVTSVNSYVGGAGSAPVQPPTGSASFTAPGTHSFEVPANVFRVEVTVIGGGGGGGGGRLGWFGGGGGGGGGAAMKTLDVVPGQIVAVVVGVGGAGGPPEQPGGAGGATDFGGMLNASGGAGGSSGTTGVGGGGGTGVGGDLNYVGGAGGTGNNVGGRQGGSGGAGLTGNGSNGSHHGGPVGDGNAPGGNGGAGAQPASGVAGPGAAYGGGGGGANGDSYTHGSAPGAGGYVQVVWGPQI